MHTISPRRLAWLDDELRAWQAEGLLDAEAARAVRARYQAAGNRFTLVRVVGGLGAAFIGAGLIWLVAANLDALPPLVRFAGAVLLWAGIAVGAELYADRRSTPAQPSPLTSALRALTATAAGAVVFQAAQSLQVPAYDWSLVGWWAAGTLLYAYVLDDAAALAVAIGTGTLWLVGSAATAGSGSTGFVAGTLLGGILAASVAALHAARWRPRFDAVWRPAAALATLIGLFVAALPNWGEEHFTWPARLWWWAGPVLVLAAVAVALARGWGRIEVVAAALTALAGLGLGAWKTIEPIESNGGGATIGRGVVAVLAYLVLAAWIALLGVKVGQSALTGLALAALVLFVTVQSFAVFAPIISGASLFLAVGAVLLGSGFLADRARRRLLTGPGSTVTP